MSVTKHTPGPWGCVYTSNHAHDYRLTKPNGQPLPVNSAANDHSEQRANARLITAAPDMLAELIADEDMLLAAIPHAPRIRDLLFARLAAVRAAIAKARGEG